MYYRNVETQKRYAKKYRDTPSYSWTGAYWFDKSKGRYVRLKRCPQRVTKHYKKESNKAIRNYKGEIPDGSSFKKIYDLWWNLF